jgi:hypothetical protein
VSPLDILRKAASAAYGSDWQRPLARELGAFRPSGARVSLSDRQVRRWAAGDSPVPAWALQSLPDLLSATAKEHDRQAEHLRRVAAQVSAALERSAQ